MLNWTVVNRATDNTLKDTLPKEQDKEIVVCVQETPGIVEIEAVYNYEEFYDFFDFCPNLEMAWAYIELPSPWYATPGRLEQ